MDGPLDIRLKAADDLLNGDNQYPPMLGLPALRRAVAEANSRFYGLPIDPDREVLVTSGATEALSDCLNALIEPGDEIILIEPLYDCYLPLAERLHVEPGDAAVCLKMTEEAKVTAVPVSAFYRQGKTDTDEDIPRQFVRFCFSKKDGVLDAVIERIAGWLDW